MSIEPPPVEPPPPIEPPPVLDPPSPTNPIGWIVAWGLALLMALAALGSYFSPSDSEPGQSGLQESLRYAVSLRALGETELGAFVGESGDQALARVYDEAVEAVPDAREAARIALVAAYELDIEPAETVTTRLSASREPIDEAFIAADLGRLNPEAEQELRDSGDFASRLALVHGGAAERSEFVSGSFALTMMVLASLVTVLALAGGIALIGLLVARKQGRLVPVGLGENSREDGDREALRFGLYIFAFVLAQLIVAAVMVLEGSRSVPDIVWSAVTMAITFGSLFAIAGTRVFGQAGSIAKTIGPSRPFWSLVGKGLFAYLCLLPVLVLLLVLVGFLMPYLPTPDHPINQDVLGAGPLEWVFIYLVAVVFAPLIEEIAFRGFFFSALSTRLRPFAAALVCGLVFASIHPQGPLLWPILGAIGAGCALARYYTGSLVPSITMHLVHNGAVMTALFLLR